MAYYRTSLPTPIGIIVIGGGVVIAVVLTRRIAGDPKDTHNVIRDVTNANADDPSPRQPKDGSEPAQQAPLASSYVKAAIGQEKSAPVHAGTRQWVALVVGMVIGVAILAVVALIARFA